MERSGPAVQPATGAWWRAFGDSRLDALVSRALHANQQVEVARARIEEAHAVAIQQLAPLMPTASWDSTINAAPFDSLGFQFGASGGFGMAMPDPPTAYYTASSLVRAGVELDITGRNVLAHRAAKIDERALKGDLNAQQLAISATVAQAYYDLVAAHESRRQLDEQMEANESLLQLTEVRFRMGQVTAIDVLQQRQQVAATRTLIPQAELQIDTAEQQLSVLLGERPGRSYRVPEHLPDLPPPPQFEDRSWEQQRPDVQAAELRVDAADTRVKRARRQFAPSLTVSGQMGVQAIRITEWNSQFVWGIGATLSVPLSTGGFTWGRLKQARAQQRTVAAQAEQLKLDAAREVAQARSAERHLTSALEATHEQAKAARTAFEESKARYAAGLSEYLPVITALVTAQRAELSVITAERDLIVARIQLYTALGGGT